jgi:hypothetical protein
MVWNKEARVFECVSSRKIRSMRGSAFFLGSDGVPDGMAAPYLEGVTYVGGVGAGADLLVLQEQASSVPAAVASRAATFTNFMTDDRVG